MIDYEKQNKEFSKWWDDQVLDSNQWTTLERIAAQNAWMEAHKRALNLYNVVRRSEQLKPLPPNECSQCGVLINHRLNECGDCRL